MPEDLLADIRAAARDTGLSQADVVRQSVKAGLPKVRRRFRAERKLKPFTKAESRTAFGPDPEWDPVEKALASRVPLPPEED
jgi:hypothetical protein